MSVSPKREFLRGLREKLKQKIRTKDEGEDEEKEFASQEELQAALSEDKSSLIQETELSIKQEALRLSDPCKYNLILYNNFPYYYLQIYQETPLKLISFLLLCLIAF